MFFNGWDGFGSFIRLLDYAVRALSNPTEGRRSRRWCVCVCDNDHCRPVHARVLYSNM